jgi:hypothetical protein
VRLFIAIGGRPGLRVVEHADDDADHHEQKQPNVVAGTEPE